MGKALGAGSGGVGGRLRQWLAHPAARGLAPDDDRAPSIHREIIRGKPLLRDVYDEWYAALAAPLAGARPVLEIGSGAGYLADVLPGLITSDVRATPATRVVLDAHHLPFAAGGLGAITMTNVLHHLPDARTFFAEAGRAVRPGGVMALVEPWVTPWSRLVYRHLHHEPFDPDAAHWAFEKGGPLSAANGACHGMPVRARSQPDLSVNVPRGPLKRSRPAGRCAISSPAACRFAPSPRTQHEGCCARSIEAWSGAPIGGRCSR